MINQVALESVIKCPLAEQKREDCQAKERRLPQMVFKWGSGSKGQQLRGRWQTGVRMGYASTILGIAGNDRTPRNGLKSTLTTGARCTWQRRGCAPKQMARCEWWLQPGWASSKVLGSSKIPSRGMQSQGKGYFQNDLLK